MKQGSTLVAVSLFLVATFFSTAALAAGSSYAGSWHASFSGGNTGTCQLHISYSGVLTGTCKGNLPTFQVRGKVFGDHVRFGIASTGARFFGIMKSDVYGVGRWRNGANFGTWNIQKN